LFIQRKIVLFLPDFQIVSFLFYSHFMKKTFYQLLLPLLLLTSWGARGQTLQQESFEIPLGTGASKVDVANSQFYTSAFTGQAGEYFVRTSNANLATDAPGFSPTTGVSGGTLDGSFYVAGEGVRGPSTGPTRTNPGTITLVSQSTTGYSGLKVVVALASTRADGIGRMEADDALRVQVRFDGAGSWITIGQFFGDNTVGGNQGLWRQDVGIDGSSVDDAAAGGPYMGTSLSDFTFNVIGSPVSAIQTRIVVDEYGTSEEFAIDNIRLTGVVGTNQAPVLANIEGSALPYAEGSPATPITSTLTVADGDNANLTSGTVRFTAGFTSTEDNLQFVNQNGISGSYNTGTGILTLTGSATKAAYQAALRSIRYYNSDINDAQAGTRTVSFIVTDGTSTSVTVTRDITVTSALDAASTLPYTEDLTTDGEGLRYSSNHFATTNGTGTAFFRTNVATNANGQFNQNGFTAPTFTNISNSWYWYGAGVSNSTPTGYFITKQLNAASYVNLQFQVRLGATSGVWDANDQTRFYYRVGSGSWVLFGSFRSTDQSSNNGNGNMAQDVNPANLTSPPTGTVLSPALQNITFNLPSALNGQLVDFKIEENNDSGTGAGEVFAFDLIQVSGTLVTPPTVTTAAATSVTTTSAVLGGSVTADGGDAVTGRGVVYSATNTTPAIAGTGVTQDANGTGTGTFSKTISGLTPGTIYYVRAYAINSAGTSYGAVQSFTTTPNAPVVNAPANGSLNNTSTPAYTGTAQAGSTVTVYVDGTSVGTTTATGGSFSLTQPTALAQGSHTVFAQAAISGSAQSANSTTNTFTVDTVQPTVAITSSAGASGSTTNTTPIPFTVTFSEAVTGFVAGDVTVTNGSIGTVSGSGTTYTFNVTPTTAGTATTVNVPAAVAQDAAGNSNTAAPSAYSITYNIPSTTVSSITRLMPSPTATAQVSFRVVFAAPVTGVTLSNFGLTFSGISSPSFASLSGSGTTYILTFNTGTGNGTMRLNVANSSGISPTVTNVPYTSGEVYTITKSFAAAPQLTIVGTGGTGSDVTAFVDTVRVLSGGSAFAKALRNGSFEYHGALANGDFGYNPTGASWTFNSQSGIAESGSAFTPVTPIPNGIAVAFVQSNGGGNGQLQQNLAVPTGSSYQVSFQAAQRVCCTTLDQALNVFLNGVFIGNIQPSSSSYSTFTSATFAVTAPALTATVSTTSASPTSTAPIPFSVTFSQSVGTTFDASDVTVTGGTLNTGTFSGSGPYTFTVTPTGTGTVTVSLAANVANDANNTQNSASNSVSVQYSQPVTAAPVITSPANNSLTNQDVTISGTAPAGSAVEVYVSQNGTAFQDLGTYTASASGTFTTTAFTLPSSTYQTYATAQSPGASVSPNSGTITFIVDVTRPSVAITSTAGTSGTTTTTSPIPFTVTFSEAVTGFVAGDVTVTNGTIGTVSGSGTTYTFNVTPAANGAVTVNVPANVAQDAAGNGNTGATSAYSITYSQPVTAAPVVSAPANGSLINTSTPTYSGTAVAGSTVTVYVDGTAIGTTTATAGSSFSLVQPTALAQGSHTVRATAQTTGSAVSVNSNTNTFTVDTVQPTVAITSTTGASGSTSGNATFAYTVTFSESVTGFVAGDITVTNGSISGFTGSGTTYTFNVTPAANGAVTVNVLANVAQDAAGNGNTAAASAYTITYSQPVTAAPVITIPANNTFTNQAVTISGTAPANSTVVLYLSQNGGPFNPQPFTATASGTFTTGPLPFPEAIYQVYGTAQSSGSAVSAASGTITFTVDTTPPTVAISSTAGASGSNTTTTPIPFTVTFSEAVTGFVAGDVTVTNGTIGTVSGSGTTYTFNVTPTTAGTATTVNVPANVAVDAAGNGNTGATSAYSLTYQPTAVTWNGLVSTDWFTAGNWTPAVVPTTAIDATIPAGRPNMPVIGASTASVKALGISSGATVSQTGGTLDVRGNLTNNGTFQPTGGTVALGASTLTSILGSSNTRFWNLTVNASGAQSSTSASTSVQRLFTLNGNFTTNGNPLTMESNATTTALLVNNGSSVIVGNVTVQRYIASDLNAGLGYRHYSAPVSNATVASLTTASFTPVVNPNYNTSATPNSVRPFPTVYYYDQARLATSNNSLAPFDKGWTSPSALTDLLTVGKGYTVNLTANQTLAVTGPQNNGSVTQSLSRTTTLSTDAGWQLLGNPYPSPLDYSLVAPADRTGLDAAMYVFESTSLYGGTYRANVNGVGGNANSPNAILAQGQGFFVRVSNGQTAGALTLRNSHRPTGYQNPVYHRTTETRPLVQLDLQSATGSDPLYVYFEQDATAGTDSEFDAVKLPNSTGLNLAAWAGNDKMAINALPLNATASVTVPLFIGLPVTGTYTLHAEQVLNFGAGEQPFLRDLQLGTLTDLSLHPDYTFTMNAANTTPRFELVFGARVLGVASAKLAAQVAVYPNPASKAVFVELPYVLNRKAVTAALVDALGRVVLTQALPAGQPTYTLPLTNLATGVYSLRLQTEAGVVVKKLVVE
jgi:hypothetical protein